MTDASGSSSRHLELIYEPVADLLSGEIYPAEVFLVPADDWLVLHLDRKDVGSLAGFQIEGFTSVNLPLGREHFARLLGDDAVQALDTMQARVLERLAEIPEPDEATADSYLSFMRAGAVRQSFLLDAADPLAFLNPDEGRAARLRAVEGFLYPGPRLIPMPSPNPQQGRAPDKRPDGWLKGLFQLPLIGVYQMAAAAVASLSATSSSQPAAPGVGDPTDTIEWPEIHTRLLISLRGSLLIAEGLTTPEFAGRPFVLRSQLSEEVLAGGFVPAAGVSFDGFTAVVEAEGRVSGRARISAEMGRLSQPISKPRQILVPETTELAIGRVD